MTITPPRSGRLHVRDRECRRVGGDSPLGRRGGVAVDEPVDTGADDLGQVHTLPGADPEPEEELLVGSSVGAPCHGGIGAAPDPRVRPDDRRPLRPQPAALAQPDTGTRHGVTRVVPHPAPARMNQERIAGSEVGELLAVDRRFEVLERDPVVVLENRATVRSRAQRRFVFSRHLVGQDVDDEPPGQDGRPPRRYVQPSRAMGDLRIETLAIHKVFGDRAKSVPISSIKGMIGHLIAAAGAVELITCVLAIRDGMIPPTINYQNPDVNCDLDYVPNKARATTVRATLSNSFGFGGTNASLIFAAYGQGQDNAVQLSGSLSPDRRR